MVAPLAPIAPAEIAEKPNELALSLLIKPGVTFPASQGDGKFEFAFDGKNNMIWGEFGLAFDVANLARMGDHFGIGLRTDLVAGFVAAKFRRASLLLLAAVVLAYQIIGGLGEWAMTGSWQVAMQDFRIGVPGMLVQIFGGYLFINRLIYK